MNEQMKKVLHAAGNYSRRLHDFADYIQKSGGTIDVDNRDADNLRDATEILTYLAYMYERLDEELERTKKQ